MARMPGSPAGWSFRALVKGAMGLASKVMTATTYWI